MGSSEAEATSKSDKVSPLHQQQQIAIHPYPEWAAMQPYYAPGVGVPHTYYASAVIPGQPYPYIWGPQPFMPPFGTPYPAIYPHTAYMHPSASHSSQSQGQGNGTSSATSEAAMPTPPISGTPAKSSAENKDSVSKKLKGIDGLAVSTSNGNVKTTEGSRHKLLLGKGDTEGSSDGSAGSKLQMGPIQKRSTVAEALTDGKNGNVDTESSSEENSTKITLGVPLAHSILTGEAAATPVLNVAPTLDLSVSTSGTVAPVRTPPTTLVPKALNQDHWLQDDREMKRERRKQSNRESARRSRLRKQAETEELALKVESFTTENITLRSEIDKLSEMLEKLRQENSALRDKLKIPEGEECVGNASTIKLESQEVPLITLGSLEANGPGLTTDRNKIQADPNTRLKLHQLLEPGPKTDAVAAS